MRSARGKQPESFARAKKAVVARIVLVSTVLAFGALAVLVRSFQLQILDGDKYASAADRQALSSATIAAKRGMLKDRHGAELAISIDVDSIYAEPKRIKNAAEAAEVLAPLLSIERRKLEARLSSDRRFVYLKRRVEPGIAEKVRGLDLPGIGTRAEPRRFYSHVNLAAHILGFTDHLGEGRAGVEKVFDPILRGRSVELALIRDARGTAVASEGLVPEAALEGDDVYLTIDRQIQHVAEAELEKAVLENEGTAGAAVVLAPQTGEILALASFPTFNPNNLKGSSDGHQLNRAVSALYEPGSTMKMVTIAAALEEKLIHPDDRLDCENGEWRVGGRTIRDSNHKYGVLSIAEVMKVSSNICSAKIGMALGPERLHRWLFNFGFGEPTGVQLPGELRGLIRPPETWREISLANIAFGQGLSVTPLQVVQAAQVLANRGVLLPPRLFLGASQKAQKMLPVPREPARRIISEQTARIVTEMMSRVTEEGGTAPQAALPGFLVAGKTGTAQKIDPLSKAYSRSLYTAWFVGFLPADRPSALVLVMVDEPKRSIYGGPVAGPAFREIARASLAALDVFAPQAPGESPRATPPPPPAPAEAAPNETARLFSELSPAARALLGEAVEPTIAPKAWDLGLDLPPIEGPQLLKMPNFAGLELREVLERSAEVQCDLVLKGTGRAAQQRPAPGASLSRGDRCEVVLSL